MIAELSSSLQDLASLKPFEVQLPNREKVLNLIKSPDFNPQTKFENGNPILHQIIFTLNWKKSAKKKYDWDQHEEGEEEFFRGLVGLVIEKGVPLDQQNHRGSTPLFLATSFGFSDIVQQLLDRGADMHKSCPICPESSQEVNSSKFETLTSLELSVKKGDSKIFETFLCHPLTDTLDLDWERLLELSLRQETQEGHQFIRINICDRFSVQELKVIQQEQKNNDKKKIYEKLQGLIQQREKEESLNEKFSCFGQKLTEFEQTSRQEFSKIQQLFLQLNFSSENQTKPGLDQILNKSCLSRFYLNMVLGVHHLLISSQAVEGGLVSRRKKGMEEVGRSTGGPIKLVATVLTGQPAVGLAAEKGVEKLSFLGFGRTSERQIKQLARLCFSSAETDQLAEGVARSSTLVYQNQIKMLDECTFLEEGSLAVIQPNEGAIFKLAECAQQRIKAFVEKGSIGMENSIDLKVNTIVQSLGYFKHNTSMSGTNTTVSRAQLKESRTKGKKMSQKVVDGMYRLKVQIKKSENPFFGQMGSVTPVILPDEKTTWLSDKGIFQKSGIEFVGQKFADPQSRPEKYGYRIAPNQAYKDYFVNNHFYLPSAPKERTVNTTKDFYEQQGLPTSQIELPSHQRTTLMVRAETPETNQSFNHNTNLLARVEMLEQHNENLQKEVLSQRKKIMELESLTRTFSQRLKDLERISERQRICSQESATLPP